MHIRINTFADDEDEAEYIVAQLTKKIHEQLRRPPAKCTAPEDADVLRNRNGTIMGTIKVRK